MGLYMERKPIKLLAMDIDGTLVTNKKEITPATRKALIDLQNQGVRLALASGRPTKGMLRFAQQLEMDKHDGLLISSNGAKTEEMNTDFNSWLYWVFKEKTVYNEYRCVIINT